MSSICTSITFVLNALAFGKRSVENGPVSRSDSFILREGRVLAIDSLSENQVFNERGVIRIKSHVAVGIAHRGFEPGVPEPALERGQ